MSVLSRILQMGSAEPELVHRIKELSHSLAFTETLFVSKAGENIDGSSWTRAYTSLKTALDWIEDNQNTGEVHVIILGTGTWEMDTTGVPTYSKNIAIYGVDSRDQAKIQNSHTTATGVLKFTGWCSINNVYINSLFGEIGIEIYGLGANGSRLRKLFINCAFLAGGADGILLGGGVAYVKITDIHIDGETTNTAAIRINAANHCVIQDIKIHSALVGLQSDHANDDNNLYINCYIQDCATGIQIAAGGATDNHFDHIHFLNNTTRINDNGTTTLFTNMFFAGAVSILAPDDVVGVNVVSGVGANAWSAAAVQIRAVSATPFRIIGVRYECAVAERTGIRLFSDGGTVPIFQDLVETGAAIVSKLEPSQPEPIWVNQGLAIHARVKSEAGGNGVLIWILIQIV